LALSGTLGQAATALLAVSVLLLLLLVVALLLVPSERRSQTQTTALHLALALFASQLVYVSGIRAAKDHAHACNVCLASSTFSKK
jgi:hypothetical protein